MQSHYEVLEARTSTWEFEGDTNQLIRHQGLCTVLFPLKLALIPVWFIEGPETKLAGLWKEVGIRTGRRQELPSQRDQDSPEISPAS